MEAQGGAASDRQPALPPIADPALRAEVEAATTSTDLEQVLTRHAAQAEIIVPRIEAAAVAEIRRDGPRDRFVIPGLEPDEGPANSVTLVAKSDTMTLVKEFPGDVDTARFSDGSVHRFVGRFPFGDVVTRGGQSRTKAGPHRTRLRRVPGEGSSWRRRDARHFQDRDQ